MRFLIGQHNAFLLSMVAYDSSGLSNQIHIIFEKHEKFRHMFSRGGKALQTLKNPYILQILQIKFSIKILQSNRSFFIFMNHQGKIALEMVVSKCADEWFCKRYYNKGRYVATIISIVILKV